MKKLLVVLISFFMMGMLNCKAETTDTVGPTIESYSFNKNTYEVGETITLDITAYDDVSGVMYAEFIFVDTSKDYEHDIKAVFSVLFNILQEGSGKYTTTIPLHLDAATYELWYIRIVDYQNNVTYYQALDSSETIGGIQMNGNNKVDRMQLKVTNSSNYTYPEIDSFKINGSTFEVGDEIVFEVTTKNNEELTILGVAYSNMGHIIFKKESDNKYVGKYTLKSPGKYVFSELFLTSTSGMGSRYVYQEDGSESGSSKSFRVFEKGKYDFEVIGEEDLTPPILNSVKFEKDSYQAPAVIKTIVEVQDNIENNINSVQVDIYHPQSDPNHFMGKECNKEGNYFVCKLDLNQYAKLGEYVLSNVIITDVSGNTSIYTTLNYDHINYDEIEFSETYKTATVYRKMEKKAFTLNGDLNSNVITSTNASNLYEQIRNSSNDAKISIDTTKNSIVKKEVFELIKGTNRTIYLETEGIVWEFKGKNITIPKDIDTKVEMYFLEDCDEWYKKYLSKYLDKGLVIEFRNNGLLPGLAKIRIKADYAFRNYIGTANLKLYFDTNSLFDLIASGVTMKSDGYYEFYILHNSIYILTNKEIKTDFVGKNEEENLGNDELNKVEDNNKEEENHNQSQDNPEKEDTNKEEEEQNKQEETDKKEEIENPKDDEEVKEDATTEKEETTDNDSNQEENVQEKVDTRKYLLIYIPVVVVTILGVTAYIVFGKQKLKNKRQIKKKMRKEKNTEQSKQ